MSFSNQRAAQTNVPRINILDSLNTSQNLVVENDPPWNVSFRPVNQDLDIQNLDQVSPYPHSTQTNVSENKLVKRIPSIRREREEKNVDSPSLPSPQKLDDSTGQNIGSNTPEIAGKIVDSFAHFVPDNEPAQNDDELFRGKEYDITFSVKRFLEFLFYHLCFFFCFGPLSFIILFPTAGIKLTKNMGFFGINTMMINQTIQYSMIMSCILVWFLTEQGVIDYVEIVLVIIAVFQRMCTIASKYGSTHTVRIKLLKSKTLTFDELSEDYMLMRWTKQDDQLLKQELYAALKRGTVDTELFFCRFFENSSAAPQIETLKKTKLFKPLTLVEIIKEAAELALDEVKDPTAINLTRSKNLKEEPVDPANRYENVFFRTLLQEVWSKNTSFVSGISVAWNLIVNSKKQAIRQVIPLALFIGFFRAIIPLLYRSVVYKQPFGDSKAQAYVTVMSILLNTYFWGANLSFVIVGLSDLKKKSYLINQLSLLLENNNESEETPDKKDSTKEFPMINTFDPFSLKSWIIIRKLFMDYGRKYYLRINWNISGFLIYYIALGTILGLQYFGIEISNKFNNIPLITAFLFEIGVMGLLLLNVLIVGSSINQKFQDHKTMLMKFGSTLSDLLEFSEIYFPRDSRTPQTKSPVYMKGVMEINRLAEKAGVNLKSALGMVAVKKYIAHLIAVNEDGIKNLEFDALNLQIQFLGIEISYELVSKILVGLGSVGFAMLQKAIN